MDEPEPATDTPRRPKRRRLVVLLALGVVLLAAAWTFSHCWLERPVGEGPAGPPVPDEPFAAAWTERPVLLLGMGDSVTAGFGASRGKSYFDRLARNPADEFPDMQGKCLAAVFPKLQTLNLAISGSTSITHLDVLEERPPVQDAQTLGIVVMTTGGNDVIHNYGRTPPKEGAMYGATLAEARPWIDNFEKRLASMMDILDQRFPGGCHVFLLDIYDPTDGLGDAQMAGLPAWPDGLAVHTAYNEAIRRSAAGRPNVHLVPMHDAFLGHGIHCRQPWRAFYSADDPHYWYGDILEDPNDRGYDAIRRLILIEMAKVREELK
jgi:lysophospholipase L1-like esterase